MLHLAVKLFALDWIMTSKCHHIKLVLLSHAVLDDIPSLAVFMVIYQLAQLALPCRPYAQHPQSLAASQAFLAFDRFWYTFNSLHVVSFQAVLQDLLRIVAPGVFLDLLCICKLL